MLILPDYQLQCIATRKPSVAKPAPNNQLHLLCVFVQGHHLIIKVLYFKVLYRMWSCWPLNNQLHLLCVFASYHPLSKCYLLTLAKLDYCKEMPFHYMYLCGIKVLYYHSIQHLKIVDCHTQLFCSWIFIFQAKRTQQGNQ